MNMKVDLLKIFPNNENVKKIEITFDDDHIVVDNDKKDLTKPVSFNGAITKIGTYDFKIKGFCSASYMTTCDRCTKDIEEVVETELTKDICIDEQEEEDYLEGTVLDLKRMIFDEVYVNLPLKTLCDEGCLGLCATCGADLNVKSCDCKEDNIDPRLSKLKDLFKEV